MSVLGPVFWYDLVRVARRQRLALWRASYGLALLAALFLLYTSVLPHAWLGGTSIKPGEAAAFAGYFFAVFVVLQFAAVTLLTPALTAGALAEERSRNTLIFLLTTQLTNREIVLGKLGTRLLQVGLLVLTGLPVLGILQFMGGVEPLLVVASFIALVPLAMSLGGLGLACAIFTKKPHNAAWRAYQLLFVYAALSFFSIMFWQLPVGSPAVAAARAARMIFMVPGLGVVAPIAGAFTDAAEVFNYPNPYFAYLRLKFDQDAGILLADSLPLVLRDYAIGHVGFALAFMGLAIARLRSASALQSTGLTHKKAIVLRAAAHPPVKDRPVLWKEIYCEAKPRQRRLALFFSRWFFFSAFMPAAFVLSLVSRYAGPLVAFALCLRVTLHAARSIGLERDRQTLDSLLTTDLTPTEIVRDKWWGSYLIGRWGLLWLIAHWGLAVAIYALTPLAVPLLLTEVLIYGAFFVSLGLFFGAYCSTTRQAAMAALVIGLFATTLLPWAGGQLLTALLPSDLVLQQQKGSFRYVPGVSREAWLENLAKGFMPAWAMYESVIPNSAYGDYWFAGHQSRFYEMWPFVVMGLSVYGAATMVLARLAAARFRREVRGGPQRAAPHTTAPRPTVAEAVGIPVGGVP